MCFAVELRVAADLLSGRNLLVGGTCLLFGVVGQLFRLAVGFLGGGPRCLRRLIGKTPGLGQPLAGFRHERCSALLRVLGLLLRALRLGFGFASALVELLVGLGLRGRAFALDLLVGGPPRLGDLVFDVALELALELGDVRLIRLGHLRGVLGSIPRFL